MSPTALKSQKSSSKIERKSQDRISEIERKPLSVEDVHSTYYEWNCEFFSRPLMVNSDTSLGEQLWMEK